MKKIYLILFFLIFISSPVNIFSQNISTSMGIELTFNASKSSEIIAPLGSYLNDFILYPSSSNHSLNYVEYNSNLIYNSNLVTLELFNPTTDEKLCSGSSCSFTYIDVNLTQIKYLFISYFLSIFVLLIITTNFYIVKIRTCFQ